MPSLLNSPEHGKETIDRGTPLIVGAIGRDAARTFRHEDVREVAWEIFKAADSDGEEEVTVQELRNALRKFKDVLGLLDYQAAELLDKIDLQGYGYALGIPWKVFCDGFCAYITAT